MTIRAIQHIPNWVDGPTPEIAEVDTQAALLAIPWIAGWGVNDLVWHQGTVSVRPFYRWSLSDTLLMAEYDAGRYWWVVARISDGAKSLSLPRWEPQRSIDTLAPAQKGAGA